jgi:phage terminase small subunit
MNPIASIQPNFEVLPAVEPIKKSRSAPNAETGLTEKQERFAQEIMAGANYTAAYRAAFSASGMTDGAVWVEAHRLAASPKVTLRLDQLRAAKEAERRMQAACLSQFVVEGWKQLAQPKIMHRETDADGNPVIRIEEIPPAVRTRNLELIAKHLGMFVERIETADVTDRSADEIEIAIRQRLAQYPT